VGAFNVNFNSYYNNKAKENKRMVIKNFIKEIRKRVGDTAEESLGTATSKMLNWVGSRVTLTFKVGLA